MRTSTSSTKKMRTPDRSTASKSTISSTASNGARSCVSPGHRAISLDDGLYYFDRDVHSGPRVDLTGVGFITGRAFAHDDTESWALFGQAEYDFTPNGPACLVCATRMTDASIRAASGRRERSRGDVRLPAESDHRLSRETVGDLAVHDDDYVTAACRAPLAIRDDDWLVYGSWSRGIKSAGFNQDPGLNGPRDPTTIPVEKEVLDAYELGFKSTLADGKVRLTPRRSTTTTTISRRSRSRTC